MHTSLFLSYLEQSQPNPRYAMDVQPSQNNDYQTALEITRRESELRGDERPGNEVPENAEESSVKVTRSAEAAESTEEFPEAEPSAETLAGVPTETVDVLEQAGEDGTRNPDWQVVESEESSGEEPKEDELHKDEHWEERGHDRELQEEDLQEEAIREELESYDKAAEYGEGARSNSNALLDPYYESDNQPSDPPSAGRSLDSFA